MSNSKKHRGLGRGLDALMPKPSANAANDNANDSNRIRQVPLKKLRVSEYQPRKQIDPQTLAELSASIADKGVLQPLLVRPLSNGNFEIVAGERRFRAATQAGLLSVPAMVRELNDQETLEIAIIENLQREDLNPIEEARAFAKLAEFGLSQEEVAKAVGRSRSAISNALRLLKLPEDVLESIICGDISAGHGRAILSLPEAYHLWALDTILDKGLSVRQSEALVLPDINNPDIDNDGATGDAAAGNNFRSLQSEWQRLSNNLSAHVGSQVKFVAKKKDKGRLELHFHSQDELERILELLGYEA